MKFSRFSIIICSCLITDLFIDDKTSLKTAAVEKSVAGSGH